MTELKPRDFLLQLVDPSNWHSMQGDEYRGYADAMEQVHELVLDQWDEFDDVDAQTYRAYYNAKVAMRLQAENEGLRSFRTLLEGARDYLNTIDGEAGLTPQQTDTLCGILHGRIDLARAALGDRHE